MPVKPKRKRYVYGSVSNHRQLMGDERSDSLMEITSAIHLHKEHARRVGTRLEKLYLSYISSVETEDLWVRVHFIKATPVSVKNWVKGWLITNKYLFSDKGYQWTATVVRSTKCISLGPWSVKPRSYNASGTRGRTTVFKSC